jgi:hypothetical protein
MTKENQIAGIGTQTNNQLLRGTMRGKSSSLIPFFLMFRLSIAVVNKEISEEGVNYEK